MIHFVFEMEKTKEQSPPLRFKNIYREVPLEWVTKECKFVDYYKRE
jgi:hypothetical protein